MSTYKKKKNNFQHNNKYSTSFNKYTKRIENKIVFGNALISKKDDELMFTNFVNSPLMNEYIILQDICYKLMKNIDVFGRDFIKVLKCMSLLQEIDIEEGATWTKIKLKNEFYNDRDEQITATIYNDGEIAYNIIDTCNRNDWSIEINMDALAKLQEIIKVIKEMQ